MLKQGYSNYRLAKETGLTKPTIANIISCKNNITIDSLSKVCYVLKIHIHFVSWDARKEFLLKTVN